MKQEDIISMAREAGVRDDENIFECLVSEFYLLRTLNSLRDS